MESDQFVGRVVPETSEMMELFVSNLIHTAEEQGMLYGTKINARKNTAKVVKNMVSYIIPNAKRATMLLGVVYAHPIVSMA